jgi:type I restriction enzyme M protein
LANKTNHILFIKISNDGFDLGAQRRPIDKNDLPMALEAFNAYKESIANNTPFDIEKYSSICLLVEKEKVLQNNAVVLSGDRYVKGEVAQTEFECVKLTEIVEFKRGTSITKKDVTVGDIPVIAGGQQPAYYHNKSNRDAGAITISSSGAYAGFVSYHNYPIFASDCFTAASKSKEILIDKYLFHILKCKQNEIYELQEGGGQPHVYPKHFENWEIPLPPLEIQEQIVKEIEGYQKIIDGAKMVVENYKPTITINPEWEMVELGEVIELQRGYDLPKQNWKAGNVPIVGSNGIIGFHNQGKQNGEGVVTGRSGTIGKVHYLDYDSYWPHNTSLFVKDFKGNYPKFIKVLLEALDLKKLTEHSSTVPSLDRKLAHQITTFKVPVEEQIEIVTRIENEQQIVNANKQLIAIFEQKIKDKINEVWGVKE